MAKLSRPVILTLIVGAAALIWVFATEPDPSANRPKMKRTAVTKTTTRKTDIFQSEDYTAKFAALNEVPKNSFKPLVAGRTAAIQATPPDPDHIPASITDGDPGWFYTGLVEVNGRKMALIEHQNSGEGVYLSQGDRWKKVVVSSISDEALILTGPEGTPYRIKLGERETESASPGPISPMQPPLQGIIGADATGRIPALPGITSNDLLVQPEQQSGGRRPRRRDRQ